MSLRDRLVAQIEATGPMTLADYMAQCLMHPEFGYYTRRDPLGQAGDFTTAPEISQMFGEVLGLCLAQVWLDQGGGPCLLAELGPGRGTLMADILRATRSVPGFHSAVQVHLVEASGHLRGIQRDHLQSHDVTWHDRFETLPVGRLLLVANEFFDALPVRQVVRYGTAWREREVGVRQAQLCLGLSGPKKMPALEARLRDTKDGDIVEFSRASVEISKAIGARIEADGGAAIIVDYGDWGSQGDTFQALRQHKSADPLEAPGEADLTAHVDFEALAMATPSAFTRLTTQGVFLERLGITARAQTLANGLEGDALEAHVAAHRRLTHPEQMGTLFKVLGFYPHSAAPPPGLEP